VTRKRRRVNAPVTVHQSPKEVAIVVGGSLEDYADHGNGYAIVFYEDGTALEVVDEADTPKPKSKKSKPAKADVTEE